MVIPTGYSLGKGDIRLSPQTLAKLTDEQYRVYTGKKRKYPFMPKFRKPAYDDMTLEQKSWVDEDWEIEFARQERIEKSGEKARLQRWTPEEWEQYLEEQEQAAQFTPPLAPEAELLELARFLEPRMMPLIEERPPLEFTEYEYDEAVTSTLAQVFPDLDTEMVLFEALQNPQTFIESVIQKGRNEDTETLLALLGMTEDDIDKVFHPPVGEGLGAQLAASYGFEQLDKERQLPTAVREFLTGKAIDRMFLNPRLADYEELTPEEKIRLSNMSQALDAPVSDWIHKNISTPLIDATPFILREFPQTVMSIVESFATPYKPFYDMTGGEKAQFFGEAILVSLPVGKPALTIVKETAKSTGSRLFEAALSRGLDKWIATQGRLIPKSRTMLANWLVKDRAWLIERATQNYLKRMAARKGMEDVVEQAAKDTIDDMVTRLLAPVDEVIPGRTPELIDAMQGKGITSVSKLTPDDIIYLPSTQQEAIKAAGLIPKAEAGVTPEVTAPPTTEIQVGDTVVDTTGRKWKVVDTSEKSLLGVESEQGTRTRIGRKAVTKEEITPEVPVAEAGMPETGLQPSMLEEVTTIPEPLPKEITQVAKEELPESVITHEPEGDLAAVAEDNYNAMASGAKLPPPNMPPGTNSHVWGGNDTPERAIHDFSHNIIENEDPGRAALRVWDGTRNRMATEIIRWWKGGNKKLEEMGVKPKRMTKEDSYDLFKALHGEGPVPAKWADVYAELKKELDLEAADMLAFDPSFVRALMAHPDYFPRGWRPPREGKGKLKLGAKPGFLKPRVDATFTEMVEAGWEPVSWNPYDMLALRRMAGTEYREGKLLIDRLKTYGKSLREQDAPRDKWRVPKVGPAFEGKPYVGSDGRAYMTPKIAAPNSVANILESVYGVPVTFEIGGVDILKVITGFGQVAKRVKLFGSLFQHVDFLTRDLIATFTPEGMRHGGPLQFPALAARVTWSAISPGYREGLEARILSGAPLYKDSTISLKMVADKGWKLGQDEMLIRRNVAQNLENIVKDTPGWETLRHVGQRLDALPRFFEAGLFDGVYRESQAWALEHVIIPRLRRLHPKWTDEQIAGSAAEEVNKQFSTLGVWQSVFQQPAMREFIRTMIFSSNETEAWIKQFGSMFKGQNKLYWIEYTIATYVAMAVAANAINMLSEGEPLPPDRYVPVTFGSPYSNMPYGIAYSGKFMAPRLPWDGRNGEPLYLDLMGQADTWLRWMLDPIGSLTSRYNVLPRAVINQIQGEDFWGRDLTDAKDRARQAATDLFVPIGLGNLLEVSRQQWPLVGQFVPEQEGRLGKTGSFIQVSGLNVRSRNTRDMMDAYAKDSGMKKDDGAPVETWDDLEPNQKQELSKNENLQLELGLRSIAAVERNYAKAAGFAKLNEIDQERITRGEMLVAELVNDLTGKERAEAFEIAREFRNNVSRLKLEMASRKSQVDEDYQLFQETGEMPDDPNKRALVEYYKLYDKYKKPSGVIDWDRLNEAETALRDSWTVNQEEYVDRNIGLTEWGPLMQEYIDGQKKLTDSGYYDEEESERRVFRFLNDDAEGLLTGKFYNYKPITGESERISLKWNDVYDKIDELKEYYKKNPYYPIDPETGLQGIKKTTDIPDEVMEELYLTNPGFWVDHQRKTGLDKGFPVGSIDSYIARADIVRATSPNAPEVKLFMNKNLALYSEGVALGAWEETRSKWNIPVLEIDVRWRTEEAEYGELSTEKARREYLESNEDYRKDRFRKTFLGKYDIGDPAIDYWIEDFVNYMEEDFAGIPEDIKALQRDHSKLSWYGTNWYLQEHPDFWEAVSQRMDWDSHRLDDTPTKEDYERYLTYIQKPTLKDKDDYRWAVYQSGNKTFENWMIKTDRVTAHIKDKKQRIQYTPTEKFERKRAELQKEFEESLKVLR